MKKVFLLVATFAFTAIGFAQNSECTYQFPSYNSESTADSAAAQGWPGDTFSLRQDYPQGMPEAADMPWEKIDFTKKPAQWANAVLDYCWEGNSDVDFKVQLNETRNWYHTPWLHHGFAGREFIHGLAMDRMSLPAELDTNQRRPVKNFSLGFYNEAGAYTLGQVFCDKLNPNREAATFSPGTVYFKLVFSSADTSEVSQLKGGLEWDAYVDVATAPPYGNKDVRTVRLIQVDVAVKTENEKAPNSWVFASFVYDGSSSGETVKDRMKVVGVQWGSDPEAAEAGDISESWINGKVYDPDNLASSLVKHVGYKGRLEGVTGNSFGSMMSAASTAGDPTLVRSVPQGISNDSALYYFRNIPSGTAWEEDQASFDYSLELTQAIRNFEDANNRLEPGEGIKYWTGEIPEADYVAPVVKEEKVVFVDEEGLAGRKLYITIAFGALVALMIFGLVRNIMTEKKTDGGDEEAA